MRNLTSEGQAKVAEIAQRHGVGTDGVLCMLDALVRGGGTMAQFNHPDFGGSGQWMMGGMTMVSDLFNNALKARVDNICFELSTLLSNDQGWLWEPVPVQSSGQTFNQSSSSMPGGFGGSFGGWNSGSWWPSDLGQPNSSGGQNNIRYAYFGHANRLAVDVGGIVTVYDTGDHRISGVSQQQGDGWTLTFSSQYGTVPVGTLRVVSGDGGQPADAPSFQAAPDPVPEPPRQANGGTASLDQGFLAGRTLVFGPANGAPLGTITLAPDGGIAGDTVPRARFWSVENGVLSFYDADGRTSFRFSSIENGGDGAVITGADAANPNAGHVLRDPAVRKVEPAPAAPPPGTLSIPVDPTVGAWALDDGAGQTLATLRLSSDGSISGGRSTEARWRVDGDTIVLLHGSGRPTARFDTFQFRAGRWSLTGSPLSDPGAALTLRQT
jgi:hypothetical protein